MNKEQTEYYAKKIDAILSKLTPVCNAFGVKELSYEVTDNFQEILCINDKKIDCSRNSIDIIIKEAILYLADIK